MKLAFAHDHIFIKDNNGNLFTGGSFNNQVWKRYLHTFSEVTVMARLQPIQNHSTNKNYNKFNLDQTHFREIPSISGIKNIVKNKKQARELIRDVLIESDALIARLPSEIGNLSIEIAEELNLPYAVEVVACVWDALWNHGSIHAKLYAPIALYKMKSKVKNSEYTLYVTEEFLQYRYPTNGVKTNVSNVELESVLNGKVNKICNAIEADKHQVFKIGMIGSLKNDIKGWSSAIKALSILKKQGYKFMFYALGDGSPEEWRNLAKKLNVEDTIVFSGVLQGGEQVLNWLDNLDIYIQPSYQEGLPRAVIEAMSRGLPVVASTAGGIPELIDKNFLHKPGDFSNLAMKVAILLDDANIANIQSDINLEKSKDYLKEKLDTERNDFWKKFKDSAGGLT